MDYQNMNQYYGGTWEAAREHEPLDRYTAKTFGWMFLGLMATFAVAVTGYATGLVWYVLAVPQMILVLEHHLGLTCDPVCGLVQIPCIERNGVAAERAVNCAQLSRLEDGRQRVVSLDKIIEVMYHTCIDLQARYKETSLGGLAQAIGEAYRD